jgi:hypothetical protein
MRISFLNVFGLFSFSTTRPGIFEGLSSAPFSFMPFKTRSRRVKGFEKFFGPLSLFLVKRKETQLLSGNYIYNIHILYNSDFTKFSLS